MDRSQVNAVQLQRRDPLAWTSLLVQEPELSDLIVTAVAAEPVICQAAVTGYSHRVTRYLLSLANHSEPISFIGKRTNTAETQAYRALVSRLGGLLPHHWYIYNSNGRKTSDTDKDDLEQSDLHKLEDDAWLVLADVPNDYSPERWTRQDVEDVVGDLADLHAAFWGGSLESDGLEAFHHFIGHKDDRYTWETLRREEAIYFEEGPGAIISDHALQQAGRLAPRLLQAANGLVVLRDLGGWPGVLGETHLSAVADLLDDPVPMLRPLLELPATLLHGAPHPYHWRLSLFGDRRLIDWRETVLGPGVLDLVCFLEHFPLLYSGGTRLDSHRHFPEAARQPEYGYRWGERRIYVRSEEPADEETIVDSYMLAMSLRLGNHFSARLSRQALPAARCLYMLTQWFPLFASWFSDMPNKFMWQRANRMSDAELSGTLLWPLAGYRRYLAGAFSRFLQAFQNL